MLQRIPTLVILIVLASVTLYLLDKAKKGMEFPLRRLPTLDRMEEAVGRCAEMDKPLIFETGQYSTVTKVKETPPTLAGLSLMDWIASIAAKRGVKIWSPQSNPAVSILADEILERTYMEAGRPDLYDAGEDLPFLPSGNLWLVRMMTFIKHNKPAALMQMGTTTGICGAWCEEANANGAITFCGTARASSSHHIIFWDHWLIGEEALAAAAYVSHDPTMLATVAATDIIKCLILGLLIVGYLLQMAGISIVPFLG